jgi:hypothetical protein
MTNLSGIPRRAWCRALVLVAAAGALLAGCGGGEDISKAKLRLVNASIAYEALDLRVDDRVLRADVAYGESASYAEVDPSATATEITRSGSTTPLYSSVPDLRRDRYYTLVAYGRAGALTAALLDDNAGEPDSGEARLRLLNAAPEAGPVDLYLTPADEDVDLADAAAIRTDAAAGAVTGWVDHDAGRWRLRVTAAGDKADLRLDLPAVELTSRQIITVVVTAGPGGVLVNALLMTQEGPVLALDGAKARVRAVAAVTDSASVQAEVGDVALMGGTGAPAVGAYQLVPAGAAVAAVSVNGSAVAVPAADLASGQDYSLLVWGPAATPAASWIADDNRPPAVAGRAKLRLAHAVASLAAPLAMTADFAPVADNVAAGTASPPAELDPVVDATLVVTASGLSSPLVTLTDQILAADRVYTLFVVGPASAPLGILHRDR